MVQRLICIGIDSLELSVIENNLNLLPNFSKLIEKGFVKLVETVFPADSIPAWMTFYTGLDPSEHGVFYVFDVFDSDLGDLSRVKTDQVDGYHIWEVLFKKGVISNILFPLMGNHKQLAKGVYITKSVVDEKISYLETKRKIECNNSDLLEKIQLGGYSKDVYGGFPGEKRLKQWVKKSWEVMEEEMNIFRKVMKYSPAEFNFIYFHSLDIIQHRLWRYFDPCDPLFKFDPSLSKLIPLSYKKIDDYIGEILNLNIPIMIISDHGHKSRPYNLINVNEILRKFEYLSINKSTKQTIKRSISRISRVFIQKFNLERITVRLITKNQSLTKLSKDLYSSSGDIDQVKSEAYVSTFAGIKSYSSGGINVNPKTRNGKSDEIVESIIKNLKSLKYNDKPLFNWIEKRDRLYKGKFSDSIYPDILFELADDRGIGWEIGKGVFSLAMDHKLASGGHSKYSTLMTYGLPLSYLKEQKLDNIADLNKLILSLYNVN